MKLSLLAIVAAAATTVSAGVVITPVFADQVVAKDSGDCFFGVVTPQGCAQSYQAVLAPDTRTE
ncbi:hypothetical protein SPBR_05425 [Sporothrix brasiliensis 5110]|uniref:Uncharacterized protein n=1 Tax=Sporothrix brasiliensis 5110 TaxID=1398154 RepID=A0A0C2IDQ6_9PEZI|nr:uncharacterized protein SPBR_05425 [Sporothrix brasiliensis 5110]KIH87391.1 hypothetical protein SPBR_05425 [Sporothrix brasiliensis 5110]